MPARLARASIVAAALLVSGVARAGATPPVVDVALEADAAEGCRVHAASVVRWTPALGPAARFVVQHAFRGDQGTLIGLGLTDDGFWSTQTTVPDGCGLECAALDLVFTRFADGSSTRHPLWRHEDGRAFEAHPDTAAAERERVVLARIWAYARTVWPAGSMRQDYALSTPGPMPRVDGLAGPPWRYTGWLAAVVREGRWRLRFTTSLRQSMCWCQPTWTSAARPGG